MNIEEYQELLRSVDESGMYDHVAKELTESALEALSHLKGKEVDQSEMLTAVVSTVATEAVRQSVAIALMLIHQPENPPPNPRDLFKIVR